jgi:AmmeMemoRadiSam system protein A
MRERTVSPASLFKPILEFCSNSVVPSARHQWHELLSGRVNKKWLTYTIFVLISCSLGSGAFGFEKGDKQLSRDVTQTTTHAKGDGTMDTAQWLSEDEGKYLLGVARKTIKNRLSKAQEPQIEAKDLPEKFQEKLGTFVTVTIDGNLRGCIGHIIPRETLIEGIRENAINAAFRDPRFSPLTQGEFDKIELEISILTPPQELPYTDAEDLLNKLRPGIDGVIIKKGFHEATFLPQVWEQLPDKQEFLTHLCLKAGLPAYAWETEKLQVSIYQVQAFEEEKVKQ